jgi:uncharacterized membrane protein YdbT with pleckstrin-like domain
VAAVAFPTKLLNDNEDVILDLRPHWSTLAQPVAGVVGALVVTVLTAVFLPNVVVYGGIALTVAALVWFGLRYLRWTTTNFVVTTDRLVYRSGVIAKHGKEIPLERVNDIAFKQSVFERLIGTGDLSIESAGAQSRRPSPTSRIRPRSRTRSTARWSRRRAGTPTGWPGGGSCPCPSNSRSSTSCASGV